MCQRRKTPLVSRIAFVITAYDRVCLRKISRGAIASTITRNCFKQLKIAKTKQYVDDVDMRWNVENNNNEKLHLLRWNFRGGRWDMSELRGSDHAHPQEESHSTRSCLQIDQADTKDGRLNWRTVRVWTRASFTSNRYVMRFGTW